MTTRDDENALRAEEVDFEPSFPWHMKWANWLVRGISWLAGESYTPVVIKDKDGPFSIAAMKRARKRPLTLAVLAGAAGLGAPDVGPLIAYHESRMRAYSLTFAPFIIVIFALPLALMGAYLWNPSVFPDTIATPSAGEKNVVKLIFVAWLLLALDIGLKLGVVSQLTSIAKGIKELK